MAHALEIGNIDIVMFVLATAGVALQRAGFAGRLAGYIVFLLAGAMKFYPAALLVLVLRESWLRLICIGVVLALGAGGVLWHYGPMLSSVLDNLPMGPPFRNSFGALYLPFGVTMLSFMTQPTVFPDGTVFYAAQHHPQFNLYVTLGTRVLIVMGLAASLRFVSRYAAALPLLDETRRLFLVAGAVLLAFCFYTAPNYEYRGIYFLFTLPGLYFMATLPGRPAGMGPGVMLVMIVLLMYERVIWTICEAAGTLLPGHALADWCGIALWLLREGSWWFIAVSFTAIGLAFTRSALTDLSMTMPFQWQMRKRDAA